VVTRAGFTVRTHVPPVSLPRSPGADSGNSKGSSRIFFKKRGVQWNFLQKRGGPADFFSKKGGPAEFSSKTGGGPTT
jgi:hypothetical protein